MAREKLISSTPATRALSLTGSADWVLEMPSKVDRKGIHPLKAEPQPVVCFDLLARMKSYELLTVQAAMTGDQAAAYEALLTHPLGPKSSQVQAVLDDMLLTHRPYLPQIFPKGSRL